MHVKCQEENGFLLHQMLCPGEAASELLKLAAILTEIEG